MLGEPKRKFGEVDRGPSVKRESSGSEKRELGGANRGSCGIDEDPGGEGWHGMVRGGEAIQGVNQVRKIEIQL